MSIQSTLNHIERLGNRLPNPIVLFMLLAGLILLLSWVTAWLDLAARHPTSGEMIHAVNLLSRDGLHRMLNNTVTNFIGFAPVGTVLVAVIGIGVAEHSGLLGTALRATLLRAPKKLLSFAVVSAGVLSSLAADTGYVILIPLAAIVFASAGRHPIAGIAAAFAGVSGGFSANLMIGPTDAILAGISTEAARLTAPEYTVNAAGNYYFIAISTLLLGVAGAWVTETVVKKRFPDKDSSDAATRLDLSEQDKRGLMAAALFSAGFIGLLLWGLIPAEGVLRDPQTNSVLPSPFINGIVTVIAVYAALCGIVFGRASGRYRSSGECVGGMEQHMKAMASYLVLMFFAAQFVSYFAWSNLGSIIAINGASMLNRVDLPPALLLISFVFLTACINLFIGSASAKWALLAPIFVPMLLLMGISPEATQMAYRVGDSTTNIITPLMPYFGVVVAFAQQHQKDLGIGTLIALMLPYSLVFLLSWISLLLLWIIADWPLGPGASILLP